jgi:acetyltransferase-like isoleucine patch superfamily enzyme
MKLIRIIKSIFVKFLIYRANAYNVHKVFEKYYGVKIGANSRFTGKKISFGSEPYLIEIGNNVTITPGVKFQTHDGGVALFRKEYPGLNVFGRIKIGNNVFIGEDVMIMYGVTIGDNVVIGARSVVTKDIPSNSLAVGIPARVIKTLDEYMKSSLKKGITVQSSEIKERELEIISKLEKREV